MVHNMSRVFLGALIAFLLGTTLLPITLQAEDVQPDPSATARQITESEKANRLFDDIFDRQVERDPVSQTYLGIKTDYDKWNDLSETFQAREHAHNRADLKSLQDIDQSKLDEQTLLSYQLLEQDLRQLIEDYRWRHHNYPVNQMRGVHSQIPAFLINQHSIADVAEAEAYIARVKGVRTRIDQLLEQLEIRTNMGVIAPDFVLPHVLRDSRNLLQGAPFDSGEPSTLLVDFSGKIAALEISDAERHRLKMELEQALIDSLQPAYLDLISYVEALQKKATHEAGVWKLPQGATFYNNRLQRNTTTALTADKIHSIGLAEVERIHSEMREIKGKVGFEGSLKEFMQFMRTDSQFYYPNTGVGREQYLARARAVIDDMASRLDEVFMVKPEAALEVKRVGAFREKSAGKAFYQRLAPDGSRPGKYYANLYDMSMMPTYQLEALAYHEGIPGHHMQNAIKQELTGIPKFRRFGGVTAYSEGWGLYSELVPKEMGLYQDPYSDFGRLAMELWRAVRLVVDTGMHAKRGSREQSIDFYLDTTPNARIDAVKMVERHAVMPGQATAYKIGMLKIIEVREKARASLGEDFDIREFHDVVLKNGAVPLNVLEAQVDSYIARKKSAISAS